jgi:PPK2 family polyphosphate:nucleotide phosphotransferase
VKEKRQNSLAEGAGSDTVAFDRLSFGKKIEICAEFSAAYRVDGKKKFRLKDTDPADTEGLKTEDKPRAKNVLETGREMLSQLQERLYAQDRWAALFIFQAMDAAGKDSAIKHVMSGINPQGCQIFSFKAPSPEELDHDYMWRCMKNLPERGRIGIFNRSYYEEVLTVRVHEEVLEAQRLPPQLVTPAIWDERYEDIRNVEQYMTRNGIVVRKFFLHISKKEQKKRFLERLSNPDKNWKYSIADLEERGYWDDYAKAYETMIRETSTKAAPWYVIPADNKWFTRLVVAAAIIEALGSLNLEFPKVSAAQKKELEKVRAALERE